MSFIIRPGTPQDLEAILAIADASPEAPHWRPADYDSFLTPRLAPPLLRTSQVAASASAILGFAAASLLLDADPSSPENRCELDSIAVAPTARRQGMGGALLEAVLHWAAAHGARRFTLEVRAGNDAALRLYRRLGLTVEGRRPRYYADPEDDALLMGRMVTPVPGQAPLFHRKKIGR